MADLADIVATFGQVLHVAGIPATPERRARFAQAVIDIDPTQVTQLYWVGRVTLISSREQIEIYDLAFNQVFRGIIDLTDTGEGDPTPNPENSRESGDQQPARENSDQTSNQGSAGTSGTPGRNPMKMMSPSYHRYLHLQVMMSDLRIQTSRSAHPKNLT